MQSSLKKQRLSLGDHVTSLPMEIYLKLLFTCCTPPFSNMASVRVLTRCVKPYDETSEGKAHMLLLNSCLMENWKKLFFNMERCEEHKDDKYEVVRICIMRRMMEKLCKSYKENRSPYVLCLPLYLYNKKEDAICVSSEGMHGSYQQKMADMYQFMDDHCHQVSFLIFDLPTHFGMKENGLRSEDIIRSPLEAREKFLRGELIFTHLLNENKRKYFPKVNFILTHTVFLMKGSNMGYSFWPGALKDIPSKVLDIAQKECGLEKIMTKAGEISCE